jgi:hypothetical protein
MFSDNFSDSRRSQSGDSRFVSGSLDVEGQLRAIAFFLVSSAGE